MFGPDGRGRGADRGCRVRATALPGARRASAGAASTRRRERQGGRVVARLALGLVHPLCAAPSLIALAPARLLCGRACVQEALGRAAQGQVQKVGARGAWRGGGASRACWVHQQGSAREVAARLGLLVRPRARDLWLIAVRARARPALAASSSSGTSASRSRAHSSPRARAPGAASTARPASQGTGENARSDAWSARRRAQLLGPGEGAPEPGARCAFWRAGPHLMRLAHPQLQRCVLCAQS